MIKIRHRHMRWLRDRLFETTTWVLTVALLVSQIQFVSTAEAASPGTSTVSAGSAPPPAATAMESFQPDLFTGRATTSIPITVPPGRRNLQPSLALSYASSARNGWLGVGWGMDIGYIERSTRDGVPGYDAADTFAFLFQGVNSELIEVYDETYRAEDEGLFLRFENMGEAGWEATDKSGTRYFFGRSADSRIQDGTRVFRWCLDKIVDPNGNTLSVGYVKHDGQAYLSQIDYTGHEPTGLAPANRVTFALEDRPDVDVSYRAGFALRVAKRLARIETFARVDGALSLARRYVMSYTASPRTARSLLTSVQQFGSDGATSLPPNTFLYHDSDEPQYSVQFKAGSGGQVAWNIRTASYDCGHNNYGYIGPYNNPPCGFPSYRPTVVVSNGTKTVDGLSITVGSDGRIQIPGRQDVQIHAWTSVFADTARTVSLTRWGSWDVASLWIEDANGVRGPFNSGNLGSLSFSAGWSIIHIVGYNQNQGYSMGLDSALTSLFNSISPSVYNQPQMAGDVNGSGITDLISFQNGTWTVSLAQPSHMAAPTTWLTGFGDSTYSPLVGDWNADGLVDVAIHKNGSWRFATSDGTRFIADGIPALTFGNGTPLTGDFNGDGITDLGSYKEGTWSVALGSRTNFAAASSFNLHMSEGEPVLAPHDVRWFVRVASYDCGHNNYGCIPAYANPPCGAPNYSTRTVSGTMSVGGINVTVGANGSVWLPAGQDRHTWAEICVYLKTAKTLSLPRSGSWDVACLYTEPQGGGATRRDQTSVAFPAGWSKIHLTGYNQNQGISYGLSADLRSQVDIVSPTIIEANVSNASHLTGDFNGDGLTDIAVVESGQFYVAYSNGREFVRQAPWIFAFGSAEYTTADFNGDGLTDIAYFDRSTGKVRVSFSRGANGFSTPADLPFTLALRSQNDKIQLAEFNGDGLSDPAVFNPITGSSELVYSSGTPVDLLREVSSGLGGVTRMTYQASTLMNNTFLPMVMPLVTETRISDGMGRTNQMSFTYSGGLYDSAVREFRGFARVESRDCELTSTVSEFHQDEFRKGRVLRTETRDADGNLWSKTERTWNTSTPYPGLEVYFTHLASVDMFDYGGAGAFRQTRVRHSYDDYGNLTGTYMDGDVAIPGDERATRTTFHVNTTNWILNTASLVQTLDAASNVVAQVRFCYDGAPAPGIAPVKGNLTRQEKWLNRPSVQWVASTLDYDAYGNVVSAQDALGRSISNVYDATQTYLASVDNALGHRRTTTYDPRTGQVLSTTDANGVTGLTAYDALGRRIRESIVDPGTGVAHVQSEIEYDLSSVPIRTKVSVYANPGRQNAIVTYHFIDGLGRTVQVRSPAEAAGWQVVGGASAYDGKGRVIRQWTAYLDGFSETYVPHTAVAGLAPPAEYTYDVLDRTRVSRAPDGSAQRVDFSPGTITYTDANGHVTRKTVDAYGRVILAEEFNGAERYETVYKFDVLDRVIRVADAQGNESEMTYDSLGRKIAMSDPDTGYWQYDYDALGNMVRQTDARGVQIAFTFDALNRLTRKDYSVPAGIAPMSPAIYTYDDPAVPFCKGKLARMSDASGTLGFRYDYQNRVVEETRSVDGGSYSLARTFDLLGRLLTLTHPNGHVVGYTYNAQGGIETVTLQAGGATHPIVTNIDYNAASQITRMEYGNGVVTDYTFNPLTLRLAHKSAVTAGGTPLQDLTYTFDAVGNVKTIADAVHTGTQSFDYDDLNRLISASGASYGAQTFAYDAIGNMTSKGGVAMSYGAGPAGPHAVTATSSGLELSYDANGNMTGRVSSATGRTAMTYDAENRLAEVSTPVEPVEGVMLASGWNLVGFPSLTSSVSAYAVPGLLGGSCDQITRLNPSTQLFESCAGDPAVDQFNLIEQGRGYWVHVTDPGGAWLPLPQGAGAQPAKPLTTGWHLLAGPPRSMPVSEWLGALVPGADYGQVKGYAVAQSALATVARVEPGQGYYVQILRPCTWVPPAADDLTATVRFTYDADGGRVKKTSAAGNTLFIGIAYEIQPDGSAMEYVMAGGERLASLSSSGALRYYLSDHLGSASIVTDSAGQIVELAEYAPYGTLSRHEGSAGTEYLYTGQRLDSESGFYYFNARYYDPELGRFLSPDMMVQNLTDPQMLNRYSYARNNPMVLVDPSGHFIIEIIGAIIVAAVIGAAMNAIMAAITGGDIGQAALLGAVQGAITGCFGLAAEALFKGITLGAYFGRAVVMAGGGAASGAAGAAIKGEPIGKSALQGAGMSFVMSTANYVVGKWSGWSADKAQVLEGSKMNESGALVGDVGINGISTKIDAAKQSMQSYGLDGFIYNPTRGAIADIVESAQEILFGPSSWSRSAASLITESARSGVVCNFVAHSQGTIMATRALQLAARSGARFEPGSTFTFNNPPMDPVSAYTAAWGMGMKVSYNPHWLDPVSALGSWYMLPTSLAALPLTLSFQWPVHTANSFDGYR